MIWFICMGKVKTVKWRFTLPCAWVGPAKLSRVVMMIAARHSIKREDFPLLIVKLGIVSNFFPQNRNLKISSCVVVFTSFAATSFKYNCSLTNKKKKTFFLCTSKFHFSHQYIWINTKHLTHIFTSYILTFLYPKGCSIISLGYENIHWSSTTHISMSTKYLRA